MPDGQSNARQVDHKNVTTLYSLLKNTGVSDFVSLLTACFLSNLLFLVCRWSRSCPAWQSWATLSSCPHSAGMEVVPSSPTGRSNHTLTWKIPLPVLFTSPRFHTHLPCPPAYKRSQAQPPWAGSEDLPFLCAASLVLEHNLNKIYLEISLGFPLNFCFRESKNPNANNKVICLYSISLTKLGMKIFYLKIPSVFQPSLSSFLSYWKTNELH